MRRISLTDKKARGIPRRLRSLKRWSESFIGWFPEEIDRNEKYCSWKIPVLSNLVEGKHAKRTVQVECAQRLIDVCGYLVAAKPLVASSFRVTSMICLPSMFDSRVCIYLEEKAFLEHASEGGNEYGTTKLITGRSLAQEWGLILPAGVHELGVYVDYKSEEDDWFVVGEIWFFGEVLPANQSINRTR